MQYFDEINLLRAFAILAVISTHVSGAFTFMSTASFLALLYMAIGVVSGFAVPLFIAISGFVLCNRYPAGVDLKTFYTKRLGAILPPYLIFSTIYLLLDHLRFVDHDLPTILYRYLTGGWNYSCWFVILIIELYLLYPVLLRVFRSCEARSRTAELLLGSFILCVAYNAWIEPAGLQVLGTAAPALGVVTKFAGFLFYFFLGMAARTRYDTVRPMLEHDPRICLLAVPLLACTLAGVVNCGFTYFAFNTAAVLYIPAPAWAWITNIISPVNYLILFTLCLVICLYLIHRTSLLRSLLETIGHHSYGIYLVHVLFLGEIVKDLNRAGLGWDNWLYYPLACFLTILLSTLAAVLIQRLPYGSFIIGTTR